MEELGSFSYIVVAAGIAGATDGGITTGITNGIIIGASDSFVGTRTPDGCVMKDP